MVRLATRLLERCPEFKVVAQARDGVEAIDAAKAHDVDLVLLDIMMPRMSGLEALPQIRRARPNAKVILWSMLHDAETRERAARLGALACIDKSDDPIHLPSRVQALLAQAGRQANGSAPGVA